MLEKRASKFTVEIVDDAVKEPPEGFSVQLWRVIGDAVRVDGLAEATIDGELEPSTATPGSPRITSASGLTVVEGDTGVARLTAYDRDTPAADLQWSVPSGTAGGADGGKFGITSAAVLAFAAAKDYEVPDDADTDGIYEVTVQVSDGVRSDTADLTVTLANRNEAPTAEAGADQSAIGAGATVTLAGSGTDPDAGDELAYAWTQTGGAAVTVSDAAVATPTFTAPTGLTEDATLTFRLRVTDKAGLYHEDAVSITVKGGPPPPPVATIAAVATPVTEGTAAAYTVTLDRAAPEALTVAVSVTETGSVLSGTPPVSVSFAKGATSATLRVPTAADSIVEADSTVTATVTVGTGYAIGTGASAPVTVEDDDVATFTVSAEPEALSEGESATLTVAIANEVTFAEAQTISLATSGTASASDYADVPTTLTLPAGASSVTATLTATADQEDEEAETVTVTASHGGSSIGSATVTINSISHDATLGTLSLSGIDIGTFSGEVTAYTASVANAVTAATVTATAAHSAATVAIEPDPQVALAEGTNEISVTVTAEDGTTTKTYTVTVTRAALPVATIAAGTTPVTEGTAATYTVTLDPAAPEALTVTVSVVETGAVLSGTPPASVSFAKGATSATLSVPTAADSIVEADSTVTATVTVGTGYTVGPGASAPVTVEDDDAATFAVSAEPEAISEGESATLTMAIANGVTFAEAQTISLATSGTATPSDYTDVPATLTLAAGASSVTVTLAASADQEDEEAETVTVTASHGGSAIGSATVTINSVSHDAALASLSLSGIDIGTFSGAATSYQASVSHSVKTTTVTATASHSAATVSIEPGPEVALAEGANQVTVRVRAEDGTTTKSYTVTVTRASLPVVSIVAVEERLLGPIGEFTLSRTVPAAEPLEVQVLFTSSQSQVARPVTVRFRAGQASVTKRVQGGDNRLVEDDITMTWTLQEGEGYTLSAEHASASLVLEESDIPEFAVSAEPAEIAEGESAAVTVAITNGVRFAEDETISLAMSGTASASDFTGVPERLTLAARASSVTATLQAAADQVEEEAETVMITASLGGSAIGSATVTISSISHDATLASLSLSGIDIGTFSGAATSYQASVSHSVKTTTVTATASHSAATVSIEPGPEVALAEGANQVTVRVTAEDGTTKKTYTVTVTRASQPVVSIVAVQERLLGPIGEFMLSRTGPATEPLEVQVLFTSSRSQAARPVTARFRAGQASVTRRVQGGDNRLVEDDITMTWTLQEGEGYTLSAEQASASLVLEESEIPEFALSVAPTEIAEGESATVTVEITNGVRFAEDQTITLEVAGGTADSGTDFTLSSQSLRLRRKTSSATATLEALGDEGGEGDETVSVTARHGGEAIGTQTVTITDSSAAALTAEFQSMPKTHDGLAAFPFELRFSEEIAISYETLRDSAFVVTGGSVTGARRKQQGSNQSWTITVKPDTSGAVTIRLPATTACEAADAICTSDDRPLSNSPSATIPGPAAALDFAHFAKGATIISEMVLVNAAPHPSRPAIYFYDTKGDPIPAESVVDLTGDLEVTEDGGLTVWTEMEPLEALTISTHGQGEPVSGSVTVLSDGPIGGVVRYSVPEIGVAGVGPGQPTSDALFPVRRQAGGIRTAAALHNLEAEAMGVRCRLMSGGVALEEVEIHLEANGQASWFIEDAFTTTDTSDFLGSVRCTAPGNGRFTAVALEMDAANRIFTTLPVEPVDPPGSGNQQTTLDFAHFANGTGITSEMVFLNPSTQPSRPAVYFYDTEGALVAPESVVDITGDLEITEDGGLTVWTEMEPLRVLTISTHGRGPLVTGSVRVVSDGPIGGLLRFDLPGGGAGVVGASPPISDALFPVRRQEGGINTWAAIHNLESSPGLVRCDLMREGVLLDAASIPLEANGQTSWLIDQAFPAADTSDFAGSVRCDAVGEDLFTAVALEMDPGNRIFTTLPVVPVPAQE